MTIASRTGVAGLLTALVLPWGLGGCGVDEASVCSFVQGEILTVQAALFRADGPAAAKAAYDTSAERIRRVAKGVAGTDVADAAMRLAAAMETAGQRASEAATAPGSSAGLDGIVLAQPIQDLWAACRNRA